MPPKRRGGHSKTRQRSKRKREEHSDDSDKDDGHVDEVGNNTTPAPFQHRTKKKKKNKGILASESRNTVLLRQRVNHKRTFYFLEQMILKHKVQQQCPSLHINDAHNSAIEATFEKPHEATKFTDFLNSVLPVDLKEQQGKSLSLLHSKDTTANYSIEIAPICPLDVCCFPQRVFNSMGSLGPLVVCLRVTSSILLIDPVTLKMGEIDAQHFFQKERSFRPLLTRSQLVEFTVLHVEMTDKKTKSGKFCLGDVQVVKTSEIGDPNAICFTKCHIAHLLAAGDLVWGYDMKHANLNDEVLSSYKNLQLPDVILVKKRIERPRKRYWKLHSTGFFAYDDDYDVFLDDLEDDVELRENVLLYKNPQYVMSQEEKHKIQQDKKIPRISLEELLDELTL